MLADASTTESAALRKTRQLVTEASRDPESTDSPPPLGTAAVNEGNSCAARMFRNMDWCGELCDFDMRVAFRCETFCSVAAGSGWGGLHREPQVVTARVRTPALHHLVSDLLMTAVIPARRAL